MIGNMTQRLTQIPYTFAFQSSLAVGAGGEARSISDQKMNEAVVAATRQVAHSSGYHLGLHPCSEVPVAVKFTGRGETAAVILKPGETISPGAFDGFEWGLPFGWLGGGHALLYVVHRENSRIEWPAIQREVVIQRVALPVGALTYDEANWPSRFPWPNAKRGANAIPQSAKSILSIQPTRVFARYNGTVGAADLVIGLTFTSDDLFGTDGVYATITFPANHVRPIVELPATVLALLGDSTKLTLSDPGSVGGLSAVHFTRYGVIGG
jgi:hypothetical protein